MSKPVHKNPHRKSHSIPQPEKRPFKTDVFWVGLTIVLAGAFFGLGKYFEFNTPGAFDSGAYVYSAAHILDGAEIGVEEKPSAQLGTLLVNMLGVKLFGFNELGPELIQTFLQAAALVLMFIAMRKLYCAPAAAVGTIIAAFCLSSPLIAKFGNVKEQYMIAFMIMSISCFILYQLNGKWFYAIAAGAFVSWAPLFKPTGMTAIGALGLFVILQPIFKHRSVKQTAIDISLLLAGAAAAIAPLYIWILGWGVQLNLPYSFVWQTIAKAIPSGTQAASEQAGGYIAGGRKLIPFSQQWPRVLRYYSLLILPIALAIASLVARLIKLAFRRFENRDRVVLLLGLWWILDMGFVWISPRSYEQYYLPLCASAAMLGGYIVWLYSDKLGKTNQKAKWRIIGGIGFIIMLAMGWNIFFGISKSPHTGTSYGRKIKGYTQKLKDISRRRRENLKGPWEILGDYIRENSTPSDKIYVWGWWPGIYVQAQRFSSAAKAFMMPRSAPQQFAETMEKLLSEFEKEMPKFIVDSRKRHIPTERPPYELWPIVPKGVMGFKETAPLPLNESIIKRYDLQWAKYLRDNFGEDEAKRYELLKPFREFVMTRYRIVSPFGQHILLELKNPSENTLRQ